MNDRVISRRSFLKALAVSGGTVVLGYLRKWFPELQTAAASGSNVTIEPLDITDPRLVELMGMMGGYNGSAFGGYPDWSSAVLVTHGDLDGQAIVVLISSSQPANPVHLLTSALVNNAPTNPAVISINSLQEEEETSFTGTIAVYQIDGFLNLSVIIDERGATIDENVQGLVCTQPGFAGCLLFVTNACSKCCKTPWQVFALCLAAGTLICVVAWCRWV
jgi:hypothetical protein